MGRELHALIETINSKEKRYNFIGWFDDNKSPGEYINGQPVIGNISDLNSVKDSLAVAIGIGDPSLKSNLIAKINNHNIHFPYLIHPSLSFFDFQKIKIGKGVIIQSNCSLTTNITLSDYVFLSPNCTIGHDSYIGKYCSIMPGANIAGNVIIKENVFFGIGACSLQGITIEKGCTIGAGSTLTKNTKEGLTYVGVPGVELPHK